MGYYVNKLAELIAANRAQGQNSEAPAVARCGIFHVGTTDAENTVTIDGYAYPCACASLDLALVDGCRVFVLPNQSGNTMIIIGGGIK